MRRAEDVGMTKVKYKWSIYTVEKKEIKKTYKLYEGSF
jgi:hypothetical protein